MLDEASATLLDHFFAGAIDAVGVDSAGRPLNVAPRALVPGSFNPIHAGHWGLVAVASRLLGVPSAFELSIVNVDKPPLSEQEVRRRMAQFHGKANLWLTRAPRFTDKARQLPGTVFIVGADTAARIVSARCYDNTEAGVADALALVRRQSCRFLVAGRVDPSGRFVGLADLAIPADAADLFDEIPPSEFRVDMSSTELRQRSL